MALLSDLLFANLQGNKKKKTNNNCQKDGANLDPNGKNVSHCFPLTFDSKTTEVHGIEGVVQAYVDTLNRVQLYGPTYFAEIVQTVAGLSAVEQSSEQQRYTILLIITDGAINDMQNTVNAVVDATKCPLSIVIVGVGTADFSKMEELDADDKPLRNSQGHQSTRDIVQFVPFAQFSKMHISALAKETLAEIPNQVEQFMSTNKLTPNKRRLQKEETLVNLYEGPSRLANGETLYYPQQKPVLESQPYHANVQQYMQPLQQYTQPLQSTTMYGQQGGQTIPQSNPYQTTMMQQQITQRF
ncbi:hypothetical protein RFI_19326, partial [Reticulomyxa filosa]